MSGSHRIAIMQPYFLPYLGYWQLIDCADTFVIYDDIQFTKKGWIHRNRYLNNGSDQIFTLPLKKDSDYLDVVERSLADSWVTEKNKLKKKIEGAYRNAPKFDEGMSIFEECLSFESSNVFEFIYNSVKVVIESLDIKTELKVSSHVGDTKGLKGKDRVLEICKILGATEYINPIGGQDLYKRADFESSGIELKFHKIGDVSYDQMQKEFLPSLSVLDMLMFVGVENVKKELSSFEFREFKE